MSGTSDLGYSKILEKVWGVVRNIWRGLLSPFFSTVMLFLYGELGMHSITDYYSNGWMAFVALLLLVANVLIAMYTFQGYWRYLFISFFLYPVLFIVWTVMRAVTADPSLADDANQGIGILILFMFIVGWVVMVFGNISGILIREFSRPRSS